VGPTFLSAAGARQECPAHHLDNKAASPEAAFFVRRIIARR